MIGLARGEVKIVSYNPEWQVHYRKEEENIYDLIGKYVLDIRHIGSTAIENLDAKPIIDVAAGVSDLSLIEQFKDILIKSGYEYRGDAGVLNRLLFVKGSEDLRTHYIHFVKYKGKVWRDHITFRDYLRTNEETMKEYAILKRNLAIRYKHDRSKYTSAKNEFINNILNRLLDK